MKAIKSERKMANVFLAKIDFYRFSLASGRPTKRTLGLTNKGIFIDVFCYIIINWNSHKDAHMNNLWDLLDETEKDSAILTCHRRFPEGDVRQCMLNLMTRSMMKVAVLFTADYY